MVARLLFLLLILNTSIYAQKESYNWYFGNKAGITFNPNGNPSTVTNSVMSSGKGCAAISDSCTGQLYFYTNGDSIINRNHQTMLNGTNLDGSSGSTQSAIIVPSPDGSTGEYYVFTVERSNGLKYSVVDMNLAGGLGGVVNNKKNIALVNPTVEKVTAVKHANKKDVWIITHKFNSDEFYAFLLTGTSLNTTPVVSSVGQTYGAGSQIGYMKASPRGDLIALALQGDKKYNLLDFNNSTGAVSNPRSTGPSYNFAYGVEFSPDGSKLYVTSAQGLYQYDLSTAATGKPFGDSTFLGVDPTVAIQLGPDGKIYCNERFHLGAINKPNLAGFNCNYSSQAISLSSRFANSGLPTFMQSYFAPLSFEAEGICLGIRTEFELFSERKIDSVRWNFGDPGSGNNTSRLRNPTHLYGDTGQYNVRVLAFSIKCGITRIDTVEQIVHIIDRPVPEVDLGEDTIICEGDTVHLWTNGIEPQYEWSTGSTDSEIYVSAEGDFWVKATNECGSLSDTVDIRFFNSTLYSDLGPDTAICEGGFITYNLQQSNAEFLWSDSSMGDQFVILSPGKYWVQVTDLCYQQSDTVEVGTKLKPSVYLGNDTVICEGTTLTLDASYPNSTYLWNDNSVEPFIEADVEGSYRVRVTNECGASGDEIYVLTKDCRCFVYLPNSFTPNSDGKNDKLKVMHTCEFLEFELEIYNRWDEIIVRANYPEFEWDGNAIGQAVPIGVYFYLLRYRSNDPFDREEHIERGMINIIK